jgi:hypothetical protein
MVGEKHGIDFEDVAVFAGQVTPRPFANDVCNLLSLLAKISEDKVFAFRAPSPDVNSASSMLRLQTAFRKGETMFSAKVYIRRRGTASTPDHATGVTLLSARVWFLSPEKSGAATFFMSGQQAQRENF